MIFNKMGIIFKTSLPIQGIRVYFKMQTIADAKKNVFIFS
jgi:hypothetical protein